jgi:hypothetical protein
MDITETKIKHKNANKIEITPHPPWAQTFWNDLESFKNRVVKHTYF